MNVIIVDDEPLARENLRLLLDAYPDIHILGECTNAIDAIGKIHRLKPDVVFLDIQMPRVTGLEMVGMLDPGHRPAIVFLTAFEEYALQAFEEDAFDYLLKPVEKERLDKTLNRLRQGQIRPAETPEQTEQLRYIPCSGHNRIWLMPVEDVVYVNSRISGVFVMSAHGQEGFTELTLRTLETRTPLLRCHRQYLVNLTRLREILLGDNGQAELILSNDETIPVSRRYLRPLKEALGLI